MTKEEENYFKEVGVYLLREVPNKGICGLVRFAFTVGLCYGMTTDDFQFYEGRYCFPLGIDAVTALAEWDGIGDPAGNWIKHKGGIGEYSNPNYEKQLES